MISKRKNNGISEGFLKYVTVGKAVGTLFLTELTDEPIEVPNIVPFKFCNGIKWIFDKFIKKDVIFFLKSGIDQFKSNKLMVHELNNSYDNFDSILEKHNVSLKKF